MDVEKKDINIEVSIEEGKSDVTLSSGESIIYADKFKLNLDPTEQILFIDHIHGDWRVVIN